MPKVVNLINILSRTMLSLERFPFFLKINNSSFERYMIQSILLKGNILTLNYSQMINLSNITTSDPPPLSARVIIIGKDRLRPNFKVTAHRFVHFLPIMTLDNIKSLLVIKINQYKLFITRQRSPIIIQHRANDKDKD